MSNEHIDPSYILIMEKYLEKHENEDCRPKRTISTFVKERKAGKKYTIDDYVCGLVKALLSNNRKWEQITPNLSKIEEIFFHYDASRIKDIEPEYFIKKITDLNCGNISIYKQMSDLKKNIETLERIQSDCGSLDAYFTSKEAIYIVKEIYSPNSKYKIANLGEALAWEFIRNMGIDGAKPDVHMRRFLGSARMGHGHPLSAKATEKQVLRQVNLLADKLNYTQADIDKIIWLFCSTAKICTENPKCEKCPIRQYCNYPLHNKG